MEGRIELLGQRQQRDPMGQGNALEALHLDCRGHDAQQLFGG